MTDRGPAIPLAVFVTASDHGCGRFSPLSARGMGRATGETDVRCGRVWGRLLSPSLPLSLKCCCSNSSLCGEYCFPISACSHWERSQSRVAAVASASGAGVRLCPSALDGESAPFGAASTASSGVCASLSLPGPVRPAGGRYGGCLPLDLVICCLSACGAEFRVLATWGPLLVPCSLCSPATEILSSFLGSFEVVREGFLPPTAGRSVIGGTSVCSGLLMRVNAPSLAFRLATAVFHCCGWVMPGYGWSPVFPSFGSGELWRLLYP